MNTLELYRLKLLAFLTVWLGMVLGTGRAFGQTTLGGSINSVAADASPLPDILSIIAYTLGAAFVGIGLYGLKNYVDNPQDQNRPLFQSILRIMTGGFLIASPGFAAMLQNTFGANNIEKARAGAYDLDAAGGAGTGALDELLVRLMNDIGTPMGNLISVFAYIAGIVLVIMALVRLTKSVQEGARGPAGIGTLMTFMAGAALLSSAQMMGAFSTTLFQTHEVANYGILADDALGGGLDAAEQQHVMNVVSAILIFVAIIGWISFVRGWFLLKATADGNSQNASLMAAMTHLFGGALAVNLGPLLGVIQTTLGIDPFGISFEYR